MHKRVFLGAICLMLLAGCTSGGGKEETRERRDGGRLRHEAESTTPIRSQGGGETKPSLPLLPPVDSDYVYRSWPEELSEISVNLVPFGSDEDTLSTWRELIRVDENQFPELMAGLDRYNKDAIMSDNDLVVVYGEEEMYNSLYSEITLLRADEAVFSFLEEKSLYAYSETETTERFRMMEAFTFDSKTGKRLSLGELFTDWKTLEKYLLEALKVDPDFEKFIPRWEESIAGFLSRGDFHGSDAFGYTLDNTGIRFYIHGDILFGEDGYDREENYTECFVSAMELYDIMNSEYYPDSGAFAANYRENQILHLPLEDKIHRVEIVSEESEYGFWENFIIRYDGKDFPMEGDWSGVYDREVSLFRTEGGHYYLYLIFSSDSDYRFMCMVDLQNNRPKTVYTQSGYLVGGGFDFEPEAPYASPYFFSPITDLSDILYYRDFDNFGTYMAFMRTHIAESGDLEMLDTFYYLDHLRVYDRFPALVLKELTVEQVDMEGNVIGTATLTPGTEVYLFRTRNDEIVDVSLDDGTLYRIHFDPEDGSQINGVDVWEIFDNLFYAG